MSAVWSVRFPLSTERISELRVTSPAAKAFFLSFAGNCGCQRTLGRAGPRACPHGTTGGERVRRVPSGTMDQLTVAIAKANHALVLDCRDLTTRYVPIPDEVAIVVCDSRMERRLASSGYNQRRAACQEAARMMGVRSLRDDYEPDRESALSAPSASSSRCHENERTLASAEALLANDVAALGELMNESHRSMRDDFEIVPSETRHSRRRSPGCPGCLGARLTGGGFGGATVNLVYPEQSRPSGPKPRHSEPSYIYVARHGA